MLRPEDDLRHEMPDSEFARESLYYSVPLPEEKLFIEGYCTLKTDDTANRLLLVWGDPDDVGYDPLVLDLDEGSIQGDDLDDFRVDGMHIRQPEVLRTTELTFKSDENTWDYSYRAVHEAFDYERNANGCPKMVAENRYEQAGLASGQVTFDKRTVSYSEVLGHRDHSWGVRDWQSIMHWKFWMAQTGEDEAVNYFLSWAHGRAFDNGFIYRDGEVSPVVACARADVEYDDQWFQRRFEFKVEDELGRTATVTGERFAGGFLDWGGVVMGESVFNVEVDGRPGVSYLETGWPPGYLEHLRGGKWGGRG